MGHYDKLLGISGTGDEYKVFSAVISCIKEFIGDKNPEVIKFEAYEPSRVKLYFTMIKRAGILNYVGEYINDDDGFQKFVLVRKDVLGKHGGILANKAKFNKSDFR